MPMFLLRARHDGRSLGIQKGEIERSETSPSFERAAGLFALAAWTVGIGISPFRSLSAVAQVHRCKEDTMSIFRTRRPKRLLRITHATTRVDRDELDLRFVFADYSTLDATVSFDAMEAIARTFGQLASAVRLHREIADAPNISQN